MIIEFSIYIFDLSYIHTYIYIHYINSPTPLIVVRKCVLLVVCVVCVITIICVGFSWSKSLWLNVKVTHTHIHTQRDSRIHLHKPIAAICFYQNRPYSSKVTKTTPRTPLGLPWGSSGISLATDCTNSVPK